MPRLAKWTVQSIIICTLLSVLVLTGCSRQFSDEAARKDFERLGGTELILEVDLEATLDQDLATLKASLRQAFREQGQLRTDVIRTEDGEILIRFRNLEDRLKSTELLNTLETELSAAKLFSGEMLNRTDIRENQLLLAYTQGYIDYLKKYLTEQSVNVIQRRNENIERPRLSVEFLEDNQFRLLIPTSAQEENVKQIFRRQGNLSLHIVRPESNNAAAMDLAVGRGVVPPGAIYYPEANGGSGLIVERNTKITGECIKSASEGISPVGGYPIVNFSFNIRCVKLFGRLTENNIGKRFAVVVDDVIITAPRINGAITGGSGFIEGNFSLESAKELARLLNSGPLPARFKIIKETTIKPKT